MDKDPLLEKLVSRGLSVRGITPTNWHQHMCERYLKSQGYPEMESKAIGEALDQYVDAARVVQKDIRHGGDRSTYLDLIYG